MAEISTTDLVLLYLFNNGPSGCSDVGTVIKNRHGRISSVNGGGDYAAQMFLGRLKRAGLVEHAPSEGSSLWRVTPKGMNRVHERWDR